MKGSMSRHNRTRRKLFKLGISKHHLRGIRLEGAALAAAVNVPKIAEMARRFVRFPQVHLQKLLAHAGEKQAALVS